ncbi:Uncharacterised protein [Chlamydia trachomatis]|nr:Uncharacterised protein [Chlamydia trachomatis]SYV90858.1 Uncharacterised protein [Mesomycoplasma hyorhinis]
MWFLKMKLLVLLIIEERKKQTPAFSKKTLLFNLFNEIVLMINSNSSMTQLLLTLNNLSI